MWAANLNNMEREITVKYMAKRGENLEMPNDLEAKPFFDYLGKIKVARRREIVKREWVTYGKSKDKQRCTLLHPM